MRVRRGDSLRPGRMVNYTHMLIGALAVTSLVMLVKYRNLSVQLSEEDRVHQISKKALSEELLNEADRKRNLELQIDAKGQEIKNLYAKLQTSEDELTNSIRSLQASNDQIETIKRERATQTEEADRLRQENEDFQTHLKSAQEELANVKDLLEKVKASAGETSQTLRDAQDKQERLLTENQKLTLQIADLQSVQGESDNLRNQLQAALAEAQDAKAKVSDLEAKVAKTDEAGPQEKPAAPDQPQPNAAENQVQVAKETVEKDKQSPDNLEQYDMLDEETKAKLTKELQENDTAALKASGEVIDQQEAKAPEGGANPVAVVPADGEDREAEDTAAEDLREDAEDKDEEPIRNAEGDEPEGGEGVVAAPKAFEEDRELSGSFAMNGVRNLLSWEPDSSDN